MIFFFSSRRRHTRFDCDWSSDVCSSDLYGPAPSLADVARIRAKGLGVYAENDARIDGALPDVAAAVKQAGVDYRYAGYPGGGHGFLRTRGRAEGAGSAGGGGGGVFRGNLGR